MADPKMEAGSEVLSKQVVYDGEGYTRQAVETMLTDYQSRHTTDLKKFDELSKAYTMLSEEMSADIDQQKGFFTYLGNLLVLREVATNLKGLLGKIPLIKALVPGRELKELLEEKIEIAQRRVQEVGNYLDTLQNDIKNLQEDVKRLNQKVVQAAQNEERASSYVLELDGFRAKLEESLKGLADPKSVQGRELESKINEVKRLMWEHGAKLRLYANAENRLAAIINMNSNFLEIMTNLHSNMGSLYEAGNEVLNELHGNLAGLASISKAGDLSVEMHKSMESLKKSVNRLAVLASETSLYLTQNVDKLTSEMKIYDKSTEDVVASNLAAEREMQEKRINETIAMAKEKRQARQDGK